jgi:talin
VDATRDALQDVGKTLEHLATQAGVVTGILDSITRAMARVTESSHRHSVYSETGELSFVDYQTRMVNAAKEVARIAQEMVSQRQNLVQLPAL